MYRVYIITASDKGAAGERVDASGATISEMVREAGFVVAGMTILPDERELLADTMRHICDANQADLILTTGGTGLSPRDTTPDATLDVCERMVPGIPEALRAASMRITGRAMLSRAAAGIRAATLIVNLPGSPKAVREHLEELIPQLEHGLGILTAQESECAVPIEENDHA